MIPITEEDKATPLTRADLIEFVNEFSRQLLAAPLPMAGQDGAPAGAAETTTAQGDNS